MKKIVLISILSLFTYYLSAQSKTLANQIETQKLSKQVAGLFSENKISKSFQILEQYWPLPKNEMEALQEKTIKYMNILETRFGKRLDVTKIKDEHISDIALRETYIMRYTYSAIRIVFTYYRSENGWFINSFKWDDSFEQEFEKTN
jgi:lipase chaperone LimK